MVIVRGDGNELIDDGGRRYLDGVSSLWCNVHGHNHPALNAAIAGQLEQVAHTTLLGLTNVPAVRLAERLVRLAPPGLTRVFYSDNGATAEEAALKMALQYQHLAGAPNRTRFASLVQAYHGDTLGAVGVGYSERFHRFFKPVLADALRLTPPHVRRWRDRLSPADALAQAVAEARDAIARERDKLAAVVVEPLMQGAAGMWPTRRSTSAPSGRQPTRPASAHLRRGGDRLRTHRHDVRVPSRPASLPTCSASPRASPGAISRWPPRWPPSASTTRSWGHRPRAARSFTATPTPAIRSAARPPWPASICSSATGHWDRLGAKIARLERLLTADVAPLPHVADVRQCGVMIGIELAADTAERRPYPAADRMGARVTVEARRRGVIVRPLGDVVVLMPPLSITVDEIDRLVTVVRDAIATVTDT